MSDLGIHNNFNHSRSRRQTSRCVSQKRRYVDSFIQSIQTILVIFYSFTLKLPWTDSAKLGRVVEVADVTIVTNFGRWRVDFVGLTPLNSRR